MYESILVAIRDELKRIADAAERRNELMEQDIMAIQEEINNEYLDDLEIEGRAN